MKVSVNYLALFAKWLGRVVNFASRVRFPKGIAGRHTNFKASGFAVQRPCQKVAHASIPLRSLSISAISASVEASAVRTVLRAGYNLTANCLPPIADSIPANSVSDYPKLLPVQMIARKRSIWTTATAKISTASRLLFAVANIHSGLL